MVNQGRKNKFHTEVDLLYRLVINLPIIPIAIVGIQEQLSIYFWILPLVYATVFNILLPLTTYFVFEEKELVLTSLIFKRRIPFSEITRVTTTKAWKYIGMKYGASSKGLVLHYEKYEEVYLSPKPSTEFLNQLLLRNPEIKINVN